MPGPISSNTSPISQAPVTNVEPGQATVQITGSVAIATTQDSVTRAGVRTSTPSFVAPQGEAPAQPTGTFVQQQDATHNTMLTQVGQAFTQGDVPTQERALLSVAARYTVLDAGRGGDSVVPSRQLKSLSLAVSNGALGKGRIAQQLGAHFAKHGLPMDVNALVQYVLRESYLETTEDLRFFAEKVKFFNNVKKEIRDKMSEARDVASTMVGKEPSDPLPEAFYEQEFATQYFGKNNEGTLSWDNKWNVETVDAAFESAYFEGDRAAAGSSVDPYAIRLGDGPAVIETPNGTFIVPQIQEDGSIKWNKLITGPNFRSRGGLAALAKQIFAMVNDGDPTNDKFVPSGHASTNPDDTMGFWDGEDPKPTMEHIEQWIHQEVKHKRIKLSGAADSRYSPDKDISQLNVGIVNVTIEYSEEQRTTTWFSPAMGILVHDMDGDDKITANELFGDKAMTGRNVQDGFQDLSRHDQNGDGKITSADGDIWNKLEIWQDLNSDGKVNEGELKSLAHWGLSEFNLTPTWQTSSVSAAMAASGDDRGVLMTGTAVRGKQVNNKEELDNYIEDLEETLQGVGDDAQLANVDLQNQLQKQQQTIQQMSNISKKLHDTAMAIIRNMA
jgi:hypothetical protein